MQKIIKRMVQAMALVAVILAVSVPASAAQIKVDGDPSDWSGVDMQSSDNGKIAKWAVLRDDKNVYFYVQQNGGNEYGLPITDTHFSIAYGSGVGGSNTQIRFTYMMTQLKNAYYGDINGTKQAYQPSKEAGKYEIEFSVPQSYFTEDDYVITYCGSSVKSKDIKKIQAAATPTPTTAAYHGITIDGSVGDWDAVSRTSVDDKWLKEIACVWDGDYFYIYLKEKETGSATTAGEKSNGKFTIYTDLGRHTVFKLYKDKIDGIDGANRVMIDFFHLGSKRMGRFAVRFCAVQQNQIRLADFIQFGNDAAFRGQILFTWEFRHTAVRCYNKTDGGVLADDPAGAGFSCLVKGNRLVKPRAFDQPRGVVFFVPKGTIHHISHAVD